MKIWLLIVLVVAFVLAGLYVLIPNQLVTKSSKALRVNSKSFSRNISDETKWKQWWPGKTDDKRGRDGVSSFVYKHNTYTIIEKKLTSVVVRIIGQKDSVETELFFIPLSEDSIKLNWIGLSNSPFNPVKRIGTFLATQSLEKDLESILLALQLFYSNEKNLYNVFIKKEHVADSTLISTTETTKGYPGTNDIYALLDNLLLFAKRKGATQTGFPMLHVRTDDSITFFTRVALPINKKLQSEGTIEYRWMLGGGNILTAEVKGGPHSIYRGFAEMENYIQDFRRTAPAIPFQSLINDRRKEPDTAKWITRLNWPVM